MSAVMAKKKPPTTVVYVRIPRSLKKALDELADQHRRPKSTEYEIALEEYARKHGKLAAAPSGGDTDE